jgi:hypothetical protein
MKKEKVEKDDKGGVDRHYQQLWGKKKRSNKAQKEEKVQKDERRGTNHHH